MPLPSLLPHLAFAAFGCALSAGALANVEVTLTPLQPTVGRGDNVLVRVTLTNASARRSTCCAGARRWTESRCRCSTSGATANRCAT